ncbi:MAG: type 4a pilus biogenesis protein PilO [Burkholderiaceae bacterium]
MNSKSLAQIDFAALRGELIRQFSGLDPKDPSRWLLLPRALLLISLALLVLTGIWFAGLDGSQEELKAEQVKEVQLRNEYKFKLAKAVNLEVLKKQREQVLQYVAQLEKQLPSKAEMAALLSDINQAGLGRSLQFELFRPGPVLLRDYYAEQPIAVRVTGRYHDLGSFASDIANLSRIVTLNNLVIAPGKDGVLGMDATVRTYRYLGSDEIASQAKATKQVQGAKK